MRQTPEGISTNIWQAFDFLSKRMDELESLVATTIAVLSAEAQEIIHIRRLDELDSVKADVKGMLEHAMNILAEIHMRDRVHKSLNIATLDKIGEK